MTLPAWESLTDRSRKVMEMAADEAGLMANRFIGPEHMLIGIALENSSVASQVLKRHGLSAETVLRETLQILKGGT